MRIVTAATLIVLIAGCGYAQTETLLHACEGLEGVTIGMGRQLEESKLFVSYAAEHVTEAVGAVGLFSRSPEGATGNTYISIVLPIEPTDFTGRTLVFDAASSTPELSRALYVRAYDASGSCVLSWSSWSGELMSEAAEFRLAAGEDDGTLTWEPGRVEVDDHSEVVKLEFITGTGAKGVIFNIAVDNVRLTD